MDNTITLVILFILTLISSTTGNLKNILLVKGSKIQKYLITGLDSFIYAYLLKSISSGDGFISVIVFVLGKVLSIYFTDLIFNKTSNTVYKCNVFLNSFEASGLEVFLFANNISFSRVNETFLHSERVRVSVHVTRQQYNKMLEYLKSIGINEPTLDISEVTVKGKIANRVK